MMSSVYAEFQSTCTKAADKAFLHIPAESAKVYSPGAIDLSYGETLEKIQACAGHYREQGYGSPMRVAASSRVPAEASDASMP